MNNKKCPNCGFINFVTASACRKCETNLSDAGSPEPVDSLGTSQTPYVVAPPQNKGTSPVLKAVLLLIVVVILFSAIVGGALRVLTGHDKAEWREFRPPQGSFVVMMPKEPTYETKVSPFGMAASQSTCTHRKSRARDRSSTA